MSDRRAAADRGDCRRARDAIQDRLDESLAPEANVALSQHLERCSACQAYEGDLLAMRRALRTLPAFDLPAEVQGLLRPAQVARRADRLRQRRRLTLLKRGTAIAAVLVVAVVARFWLQDRPDRTPVFTEAEIAQASQDLGLVLGITHKTLSRLEHAAMTDVLIDRTLPAMGRIPAAWPPEPARADR